MLKLFCFTTFFSRFVQLVVYSQIYFLGINKENLLINIL